MQNHTTNFAESIGQRGGLNTQEKTEQTLSFLSRMTETDIISHTG